MHFIHRFKRVNRRVEGFSLLETAIALTIVGILSMAGLSAFKRWKHYQQITITKQHQEQIVWAIASYAIYMGHFPYPADPQAPLDTFGFSRVSATIPKEQVGIVPYRTLGLSETTVKDGYGRYFTYIGGSPSSKISLSSQSICASEPIYPIHVFERNVSGTLSCVNPEASGSSPANPIVILLISHGINGYGAWMGDKGKLYQNVSNLHGPDEKENAVATQAFILAPLSYEKNTYYDDSIWWITRNHLLGMYAKIPCKPLDKPFV